MVRTVHLSLSYPCITEKIHYFFPLEMMFNKITWVREEKEKEKNITKRIDDQIKFFTRIFPIKMRRFDSIVFQLISGNRVTYFETYYNRHYKISHITKEFVKLYRTYNCFNLTNFLENKKYRSYIDHNR